MNLLWFSVLLASILGPVTQISKGLFQVFWGWKSFLFRSSTPLYKRVSVYLLLMVWLGFLSNLCLLTSCLGFLLPGHISIRIPFGPFFLVSLLLRTGLKHEFILGQSWKVKRLREVRVTRSPCPQELRESLWVFLGSPFSLRQICPVTVHITPFAFDLAPSASLEQGLRSSLVSLTPMAGSAVYGCARSPWGLQYILGSAQSVSQAGCAHR